MILAWCGLILKSPHDNCFSMCRSSLSCFFYFRALVRASLQESDFFDMLQLYFPKLYDIKLLVSTQDGFHGGLNKLAEDLKVTRFVGSLAGHVYIYMYFFFAYPFIYNAFGVRNERVCEPVQ